MLQRKNIAALFLVVLCTITSQAANAERISIAAIVGEEAITTSDVAARRDLVMATAGIPATVENQQKITPRIIQSLVDEVLQRQEAKRQGLTISEEELSKALDAMQTRGEKPQLLRAFIAQHGLSLHTVEDQLRAQLAWSKVVQRKLRRNVNISQEEVTRAQMARAASPGELEVRLVAIEIPVAEANKAADALKRGETLVAELKAGGDTMASAVRAGRDVRVQPPVWVAEQRLPLSVQQALRTLKEGETTEPLRTPAGIQILQLLERKTVDKQADTTEYLIKQMTLPLPKKSNKQRLAKVKEVATALQRDPGDCFAQEVPKQAIPVDVKLIRAQVGAMSPVQRSLVERLEVGVVSDPIASPDALRLIMVCEKTEPATGNRPDAEKVRQELFAEKLELEAEKHLRNLRRDAYIDVKGME